MVLQRTHRRISRLLIVLFFAHGILYYFFPTEFSNPESLLKKIKYILLILYAITNFRNIKVRKLAIFLVIAGFFYFLMYISHSPLTYINEMFSRYLTYIAPLTLIFLNDSLKKNQISTSWIRSLLVLAIISGFLEFFVFRGIFAYLNFEEASYVRIASIFLNPNNAGLMMFILLIYSFPPGVYSMNKTLRYLVLVLATVAVVILTGSRTALVLILLYPLLYLIFTKAVFSNFFTRNLLKVLFWSLLAVILILFAYLNVYDTIISTSESTRDINVNSWTERFDQLYDYQNKLSNEFLTPDYDSFDITYDNAYLQVWSDFGFFGFVIFLFFLTRLFFSNSYKGKKKTVLSLLLISGFSVNIFYIWPTAYVIWYFLLTKEDNEV